MIRRVVIRRFKRFEEVIFDLPGHVVLAGPNNTGKTTLLQAIAAWDLAYRTWRLQEDFKKHRGAYTKVPISRQSFLSVPLRTFDLLWRDKQHAQPIEIELHDDRGWKLRMELLRDTSEQMYVRPTSDNDPKHVAKTPDIRPVFVPPIAGVVRQEARFANQETLIALLAEFRAGEVLRNLLVSAFDGGAGNAIKDSIRRLFGYELEAPQPGGAYIQAEYRERPGGPTFDLTSAGGGFQQTLMLLCFLHSRPGSLLLLDEPDAHLHVILQDAVYGELQALAAANDAQLVVATHSEVIIDAADIAELRLAFAPERVLVAESDRGRLQTALRHITNVDVMRTFDAPGVLYLEDYTDLLILREWAKTLGHACHELLTKRLFWHKTVVETGDGTGAVQAKEHFDALQLVRPGFPGLMLVDGDSHAGLGSTEMSGPGLKRLRWKRYEIESYLMLPAVLARYVEKLRGVEDSKAAIEDLNAHFSDHYPPPFLKDPLGDIAMLVGTKARTNLLLPALSAAGIPGFDYRRAHEIAALMHPDEIHPEVKEKLDGICRAFGVNP